MSDYQIQTKEDSMTISCSGFEIRDGFAFFYIEEQAPIPMSADFYMTKKNMLCINANIIEAVELMK